MTNFLCVRISGDPEGNRTLTLGQTVRPTTIIVQGHNFMIAARRLNFYVTVSVVYDYFLLVFVTLPLIKALSLWTSAAYLQQVFFQHHQKENTYYNLFYKWYPPWESNPRPYCVVPHLVTFLAEMSELTQFKVPSPQLLDAQCPLARRSFTSFTSLYRELVTPRGFEPAVSRLRVWRTRPTIRWCHKYIAFFKVQ